MNNYTATVIKSGNSIALRVPKQYAQDARITPGDKVRLALPCKQKRQDRDKIERIVGKLQQMNAYQNIKDPLAWQRKVRADRPLPGRE